MFFPGNTVGQMSLWGGDGNLMIQAFHATFAVGTIIAPWIIEKFIVQKHTLTDSSISNDTIQTMFIESQTYSQKYDLSPTTNVLLPSNQSPAYVTESSPGNSAHSIQEYKEETHVQIAFSFMSIWFLLVAILFLFAHHLTKKEKRLKNQTRRSYKHLQEIPSIEPMCYRVPLLTLIALGFGAYVALESQFAAYLTAFAVKGLHLTKTDGFTLTSVFRIAFTISRIINIPIAMCLRPSAMILLDLTIIVSTYSVLTFTVEYFSWSIWISCAAAGLGMGSFYAAAVSWTTQNLQITGKAASVLNIGHTVGDIVMTFLIGQLFESYGPMSFILICLGDVSLIVVICASAYAFAKQFKAKLKSDQLNQAFEFQAL